ncbi:MAG: hypothetical protein Q7R40_09765 [Phaeospirillum sp.]|nr:hypothetical protein [Phaeospirillum sp.]
MQYRWEEIDQLAEILEAEVAGQPFDLNLARDLAERLIRLCPDIARSMSQVIDRLSQTTETAAAA